MRRWAKGTATLFLLMYCVTLLALILFQRPMRVDLSAEGLNSLSGETLACLAHLAEPVRVLVSYGETDPARIGAAARVFRRTQDVLRQMELATDRVRVLDFIDVYQRQDAWQQAKTRYNLTGHNRVTFLAGHRQQDVRLEDMADIHWGAPGVPAAVREFRVERAFTAALRRLQGDPRRLYILRNDGHGGRTGPDIAMTHPGGLSVLAAELRANNFDLRELDLARAGAVPGDAEALLAIGMIGPLPSEAPAVLQYLERGGKLLLALNPQYSYAALAFLEEWGVAVEPAWIVMEHLLAGTRIQTEHVTATEVNPLHPITRKFDTDRFRMAMTYARPLSASKGIHGEGVPVIGVKGDNVWGERRAGIEDRPWTKDANDFPAPLAVLRATEKPIGAGDAVARLAVFGSHSFLRNEQLHSLDHASVLHNTLWWLLGQEELSGVRTPENVVRTLGFDAEGSVRKVLGWAFLLVVPGCAALAGLVALYVRRR